MSQSIYKYGEDITWSLPFAFEYDMVWGAIYKHMKTFGIDLPRINAHGCPNCLWTGGRIASIRQQLDEPTLRRYFNYHSEINSNITFTFTCTALEEHELNDAYCNYLLDIGAEYGAHFIVFDDRLKDHIRKKHPDAYVVSSIIKPTFRYQGPRRVEDPTPEGEAAYYNELLKEYDLVVVRPEFSKYVLKNNPDLIDDLSRIEVLINQQCICDCPISPDHYKFLEASRKSAYLTKDEGGVVQCLKHTIRRPDHLVKTLPHTSETINKLVQSGVKHLKLRGRSDYFGVTRLGLIIYPQMFNIDGDYNLIMFDIARDIALNELHYFDNNIMKLNLNQYPDEYGRTTPFVR